MRAPPIVERPWLNQPAESTAPADFSWQSSFVQPKKIDAPPVRVDRGLSRFRRSCYDNLVAKYPVSGWIVAVILFISQQHDAQWKKRASHLNPGYFASRRFGKWGRSSVG